MNEREFDVVVWGASGFTGRLVAAHLLECYGTGTQLRWALGGRSVAKLEQVRSELGAAASNVPLVFADADDQATLDALAARTRVVCTTVGPYARHGSKLVAACVEQRTHYCDLAGEVQWMRRMIDLHHRRAESTGARIVHSCGFDSIPSDLGVLYLQQAMQQRHGTVAAEVKLRVRDARGGFSGGTVASLLNTLEEAERDPSVRALIEDPYALNPEGERRGLDGPDRVLPLYDDDFDAWIAPFPMAPINTRVVRRSNALLGHPYGHDFRYEEGMLVPFGPLGFPFAAGLSAGTAVVGAAASIGAMRRALMPLLPRSGEGPSRQRRESGYWEIELLGRDPARREATLRVRLRGRGDPGYASTSRMLGESAVCLARDELLARGGVLTPAAAFGETLRNRLTARAGVTFEEL